MIPIATPSVKELQLKLTKQIEDSERKEADLKSKMRDIERENNILNKANIDLKKELTRTTTDDELTKKILSLKSKMLSPIQIKERMDFLGYLELSLEEIKHIAYNIDELDSLLIDYYNECKEAYNNQLKTDNNILKEKAISENQFMIDQLKEMISEAVDNGEKAKYMQQLDKCLNTMNSLLKDVVLENENKNNAVEVINIMSDDYEKQKSNIFKVQIDENVKVIN